MLFERSDLTPPSTSTATGSPRFSLACSWWLGLKRVAAIPMASFAGRSILACGLGAMAVLSLPPFDTAPLAVVSFGGLYLLLDRSSRWQNGLLLGWSYGLGFFLGGLHWIGNSFFVDAERFAAIAFPAVVGLAAFLSIFPAVACAAATGLARRGTWRAVALASSWTLAELAQGTMLSGFPWNLAGYIWTISNSGMQAASVIGTYGLGFVAVLASAFAARAVERDLVPPWRMVLLALAFMLFSIPFGIGLLRLSAADSTTVPGVQLRLVQGNIPQAMKWQSTERQGILTRYIDLSRGAAGIAPTHVLWPETAVPFLIAEDAERRARVAEAAPPGGAVLTGAVRRALKAEGDGYNIFNSVLAVDARGTVVATYDKVRLVPFGEFIPLRWLIPLRKLTEGGTDFTPGAARRVLSVTGLPPFQPLICYEAIFPGDLPADTSTGAKAPAWLLNVTNDAWFGASIGPYQHFAMARMRAVERGLPLVRVANTGISAVVDAYGRITASLPLNVAGVLDAALPSALTGGTVYNRVGDGPLVGLSLLALVAAAYRRRTDGHP